MKWVLDEMGLDEVAVNRAGSGISGVYLWFRQNVIVLIQVGAIKFTTFLVRSDRPNRDERKWESRRLGCIQLAPQDSNGN